MLYVPGNNFGWYFDNWNGANSYPTQQYLGEAITLQSNGSLSTATWVTVASTSEMAQDAYGCLIELFHPRTAGADRSAIFEFGIDQAGGTSFTALFTNAISAAGITAFSYVRSCQFYLPIFIKAGWSVGVRAATVHTSTVSGYVAFSCWGYPSKPELISTCSRAETLGYTSSVYGTQLPTNANPNGRTAGPWTSLGTTTFPWESAFLSGQASATTVTNASYFTEVAYGNGSTEMTIVMPRVHLQLTDAENVYVWPPIQALGGKVPSGATVYARVYGDSTNPTNQTNGPSSGPALNVTITGFG